MVLVSRGALEPTRHTLMQGGQRGALDATPPPRLRMLAELVGLPPAGVAPLDQFSAALLLCDEARGHPPDQQTLERSNAELLRYYWHGHGGGACEQAI